MAVVYHEIDTLSILYRDFLRNLNTPILGFVAELSVSCLEGSLTDGARWSHAKTAQRMVALGIVLLIQELGSFGLNHPAI